MKNNDMISLRREKLRNLLQKEMEEYQYEVFSNNVSQSQYLLDKFTAFNSYNNKNKSIGEETNINFYDNNFLNNENNLQYGNQNNINNIGLDNQNGQNPYMNNTISLNRQQFGESNQQNDMNKYMGNNNNGYNQINNNNINYNYGNLDLDTQINNFNSHYNKLRIDEFMSKKIIQDDLLTKINQKLNKINKDINDKVYQENLAAQWQQNNQNPQ